MTVSPAHLDWLSVVRASLLLAGQVRQDVTMHVFRLGRTFSEFASVSQSDANLVLPMKMKVTILGGITVLARI